MPKNQKRSKEEAEKAKQLEIERREREAEEARILEEERLEKIEEERLRQEEEETQKRFYEMRKEQLLETCKTIETVEEDMIKISKNLKEHEEWERYMRCDGLPDPESVPQLNQYLSLWRSDVNASTFEGCLERTPEVIEIIQDLENVIEQSIDASLKQKTYWREIWLELQEAQREKLNEGTYNELLDLRPFVNYETMVYSFVKSSPLVSISLWCNRSRSLKNNTHNVEELGIQFQLPPDLVTMECVVRVLKTEYDHYSKFARSFYVPIVPQSKGSILDDPRLIKTSSESEANTFLTTTDSLELNLRRFRVLGGIFTLDLLKVPPQPSVVADCTISQVEDNKSVMTLEWKADYNPPAATDASDQRRRHPEEIEKEMKLLEKELQKLIHLTIQLPKTVFWFEPPSIVRWDPEKQIWSSEGFHDKKYNEDTQRLQVRTTRLGVMGIAMNRFANLPYQNWEIKPKDQNSASLTLYGSNISAEFIISEGEISLVFIQDGGRKILTDLCGTSMKPQTLIELLRTYGVNLFPDKDSFCYMDGLPKKHTTTESHLYYTMGLLASSLTFQWSRWNLLAGENNIVFQIKVHQGTEVPDDANGNPLVLVTPERTTILECTELSQAFSDKARSDMEFYADLYLLAMSAFGEDVCDQCNQSSSHFVHTVAQLLQSTSILSYC